MALRRTVITCGILLAALAAAGGARADDVQDAVDRVQRETGGRILSAETVSMGRGRVYRVKVLTPDGRVRVMQVPAAGGNGDPRVRERPRRREEND